MASLERLAEKPLVVVFVWEVGEWWWKRKEKKKRVFCYLSSSSSERAKKNEREMRKRDFDLFLPFSSSSH